MGVQLLQLPHSGKAQGSGGIAQAQQIGGKIHADGLHGGAALRHRGEQPPGEGMQQPGQRFRKAAAAGNLHQAAPQAQHTGEGNDQAYGFPAAGKRRGGKGFHPAGEGRGDDRKNEQGGKDTIQHGQGSLLRFGGNRDELSTSFSPYGSVLR